MMAWQEYHDETKGDAMPEKEVPKLQRLKKLREAAGFSQQELAGKAGLSISIISQIEQGAKTDVRISTVMALAKALGVDCNTLMDESGGRPRKGK